MTDEISLEEIRRFKDALAEPDDASSSDEYIEDATSNRGRKLKRDAREVYQGSLSGPPYRGHGFKVVNYAGVKRAVVYKKRKVIVEKEDEESLTLEDEDNPYDEIEISRLLAPVTNPGRLMDHPALAHTYTNHTTEFLSARALEIISKEQKHATQFARLMSLFLGDDPSYILSEKLGLPAYDLDEDKAESGTEDPADASATAPSVTTTAADDDRRVTRRQTVQDSFNDPFFSAPSTKVDRNFGIQPDVADETRQLVQIAQQRTEEYIRCMNSVRSGLSRAVRLRRSVFKWCQEMGGKDYVYSEPGMPTEVPEPIKKPPAVKGKKE